MLFYKRYVMILIMFSINSVIIMTVNGAGNQGVGPSDSNEVSGEDYVGYTKCWEMMKYYSKNDNPEAIDFARKALLNWKAKDIDHWSHVLAYYLSLGEFLDAEDILYPEDYCIIHEYGPIPKIPPQPVVENSDQPRRKTEVEKCQEALSEFGDSNQKALLYGFYETKYKPLDLDSIDSNVMRRVTLFVRRRNKDYSGNYLNYMAPLLKLKGAYKSPLEFCKAWDEQKRCRDRDNSQK